MAEGVTAPVIPLSELGQVRMYGEKDGDPLSLVRIPGSLLLSLLTAASQGFKRYATTAARDADTTQAAGVLGYVYLNAGSTTDAANGWYQWSGSAWVAAPWISNDLTATVQPLVDQAESWAEGTLPGGSGTKSSKEHAIDAIAAAAASLANAASNTPILATPGTMVISDSNGRPSQWHDPVESGGAVMQSLFTGIMRNEFVRLIEIERGRNSNGGLYRPRGNDLWIAGLGQSNRAGEGSANTGGDQLATLNDRILMANGALRPNRGLSPSVYFASLVTAYEGTAETGDLAAANMIVQLLGQVYGRTLTDLDLRLIVTNLGVSGQAVNALRTTYYSQVQADIAQITALSTAAGRRPDLLAMLDDQGEGDFSKTVVSPNAASWAIEKEAYFAQITADALASTAFDHAAGSRLGVIVQPSSFLSAPNRALTAPNISVQLDAVTLGSSAHRRLAGPTWFWRHYDFSHRYAYAHATRGAMQGLITFLECFCDIRWRDLRPTVVARDGLNWIHIEVAPFLGAELVIDTGVHNVAHRGWHKLNAARSAVESASACVKTGPLSLSAKISGGLIAGDIIRFADRTATAQSAALTVPFLGSVPEACIRDNLGDRFRYLPDHLNLPLHRTMPTGEWVLT